MRHYSAADAQRLGQQQHHLAAAHRSSHSGSGFQAAAALRSNILYKTTSNHMSKKLDVSNSMSATIRPEWSSATKNPKSNAFTSSFSNMMHEDTGLGSSESKETRKMKEELKKIKQHEERAKLYEELVTRQKEELQKKQERRRKRRERYQLFVDSALLLQTSLFRIKLAKNKKKRKIAAIENSAALRIQMYGMRWIIRKRCEQRRQLAIQTKATLKIQASWGERVQRVEAKEELNRRRHNRSRARRKLLRDMEKERKTTAAMIIQSMVRGWKGRKIIKLLEMERRRARKKRNVQQQGVKAKAKSKQKNTKEKRKKKGVKGPES